MPYLKRQSAARQHEQSVQEALREWKDAVAYFESVRDPELIDFAAYGIETARRKYMFLLKHGRGGTD
ncbi:MAG: DUF2508 family protein [Eubacteriales bacterium]|nr:DUF2508 family protein [Eubacteriales bacterium]